MKKYKKINNILFIVLFSMIIIAFSGYALLQRKEVNMYENRMAYKIGKLTLESYNNKEFQDSIENTLTDQIPLAVTLKEKYNYYMTSYVYNLSKKIVGNKCNNRYIMYTKSLRLFDCDEYMTYENNMYADAPDIVDERINDVNMVIKNSKIPVYVYFIESDSTYNFETNTKSDIFQKLKDNINTDKVYEFKVNSFDDYKEYFYKTDHHWNYKGAYKAYSDLVDILKLKNKIEYTSISCNSQNLSGSKAKTMGAYEIITEPFCGYNFELNNYKTYINGKEEEFYGEKNIEDVELVSYANYYGSDYAEVIIDNNKPKKENILLVGESYDNAIINLLATHYNKLFSIDLRHYENEFGKKFNYKEYIKENDIDKILLIGSIGYFRDSTFNLEVK